jgi:hypothetical protein
VGCLIQTSYGSWRLGTGNLPNVLGNPVIWDARLRTAERLEADADRVASKLPSERCLTGSLDRARRVPQPTYCGAAPVIVYFAAGIQAVLVLS